MEIIGGGVRIPRIQSILTEYFAPLPLGTHLNGDEAPVMGAAFIAANRSSAFRVKPVGALDTTPFAATVTLTSLHREVLRDFFVVLCVRVCVLCTRLCMLCVCSCVYCCLFVRSVGYLGRGTLVVCCLNSL